MADDAQPLQSIVVITEDDRRFKMVMRGALENLSVEKIKRYLAKSTGIPQSQQVLTYSGRLLGDDMIGADFGLSPDDILHMRASTSRQAPETRTSRRSMADGDQALRRDEVGRQRQEETVMSARGAGPARSPRLDFGHSDRHETSGVSGTPGGSRSAPFGGTPHATHRSSMQHVDPYPSPSASYSRAGTRRDDGYPAAPSRSVNDDAKPLDPEHPLLTKLAALEEENRALRSELDRMKKEESHRSFLQPGTQLTVVANANANLVELSKELGTHLAFDDNLSCVVGFDEANTLVLTVDPPTERMYVYSTLLTSIPDDPVLRLRVYEAALEWALLGRDMAGGGVGVCTRTGILMMSTSIDLRHSNASALKDTAPVFVESLVRWRNAIASIGPPA